MQTDNRHNTTRVGEKAGEERRGEERRGEEGRGGGGEGQWSPLGRGRKGWALREKRLVYWLVYSGKDEVVRWIMFFGQGKDEVGEGWRRMGKGWVKGWK